MLKKISLSILALGLLVTTSCLGKVSQNDLAELVGNVFGIQSTATMMLVYGMPMENVSLEMNEAQTSGTVTYDNFTIAEFLSLSGVVSMGEEGSMNFDLTLTEAVCETLIFDFDPESQQIINLKADGKDYDINKALEKLSAKREAEVAKEQAEAEAALPKVQTVQ
jgi:hypothetical protein